LVCGCGHGYSFFILSWVKVAWKLPCC
jgi:hypothetical protein